VPLGIIDHPVTLACEVAIKRVQRAICGEVDQVLQDGSIVTVPATVLTSAYSGTGVRLRVRLVTGDIGIVAVGEDLMVAAGVRIGVVLDLSAATFLAVDASAAESRGTRSW
jgi:hypothetical protein